MKISTDTGYVRTEVLTGDEMAVYVSDLDGLALLDVDGVALVTILANQEDGFIETDNGILTLRFWDTTTTLTIWDADGKAKQTLSQQQYQQLMKAVKANQ